MAELQGWWDVDRPRLEGKIKTGLLVWEDEWRLVPVSETEKAREGQEGKELGSGASWIGPEVGQSGCRAR